MKTLTVSEATPCLGKLERYDVLDLEFGGPELEAALLAAVEGPHSPYSRQDLESAAARVRLSKPLKQAVGISQ